MSTRIVVYNSIQRFLLAITFVCITANIIDAQEVKKTDEVNYNPNAKPDTTKKSIKAAAAGKIGQAEIKISYHSPGVRKRVIWGGLVLFDEVWVTGAHSATTLELNKAFQVGDTKIAAGKYALFTIPGENEWTIILNKNWQQHLTDDYSSKDDIVRIKIKPTIKASVTERLQYYIKDDGNSKGTITIEWEKLSIAFEVKTFQSYANATRNGRMHEP